MATHRKRPARQKSPLKASRVDGRSFTLNAKEWAQSSRWVWVKSSWVRGIMYSQMFKHLYVEFNSGAVCRYATSEGMAKSMFNAPSIGKFVHRVLYGMPYVLVRK